MAVEVILPRVDMDMTTGKIVRWYANEGDEVKKGARLFDIESDKAAMEIEAPASGILREVRVAEGESSPVGFPVAQIYAPGEERVGEGPSPAAKLVPVTGETSGVRATPLARRLARQAGISLPDVKGSGPRGRILGEDVRQTESPMQVENAPAAADMQRVPLSAMRQAIAGRLTIAKQTVPHFYLRVTCTIDRLMDMRERLNIAAPKNDVGTPLWKLSVNDFIIKAYALALQRVPEANVTWGGDCIVKHASSSIAVAVAVEGGLYTPVLRDAETKPLSILSTELKALAEKARQHRLQPAEYQGGSASISNLGMYGVEEFAAIINPPQATILAVGAVVDDFVPVNGAPVLKKRMACTLSCDHRAVDGAVAALLVGEFRRFIEDPALMLA